MRFAAETCDLPPQPPDLKKIVGLMGSGENRDEIAATTKTVVLSGYPEPGDHSGMCAKARESLKIIEAAAEKCRKIVKRSTSFAPGTCF